MDVLYRLGAATANEVIEALPDERHSSTVRTQLRLLEEKDQVSREPDGHRFVYRPVVPKNVARKTALQHVVDTFFDGSPEKAMSTLLASSDRKLSAQDLEKLAVMIEKAARGGRS